MKPNIKVSARAEQSLKRNFMIVKVFLTITPLLCYAYISLQGIMSGLGFQEVITQHPKFTIIFLIAMLNPYIAYLLHLIEKKLKQADLTFVSINMVMLLVAQALTMNLFYVLMLGYVFFKAIRIYQIPVKQSLTSLTWKSSFVCGGGSFFIVLLSSVCLFATMKIM